MDQQQHNLRFRSASAPVPFDFALHGMPYPIYPYPSCLPITIPSQQRRVQGAPSAPRRQANNSGSYPPSPRTTGAPAQNRKSPSLHHASASYPVLSTDAHNPGKPREAVLHTKNPMADGSANVKSPARPKLHLFASRKTNIEHDLALLPEPPVEWLSLSSNSATPSNESSSFASEIPSEIPSDDDSDYIQMSASDSSPVPFDEKSSVVGDSANVDPRVLLCRDLSLGLKALLKVQA